MEVFNALGRRKSAVARVYLNTGSGNITVQIKAEDPQEKVWVFELALRGGRAKRIVIPDGAVTSREAITYNDSDAIAYGITVSAYPDGNNITHKEYIEGPSASV